MALSAPELVEVEKFARALEKPEPKLLRDNSLVSKTKCVFDKVKDLESFSQKLMQMVFTVSTDIFEPGREKTGLLGFRPGLTQTDLYSHRSRLEA